MREYCAHTHQLIAVYTNIVYILESRAMKTCQNYMTKLLD